MGISTVTGMSEREKEILIENLQVRLRTVEQELADCKAKEELASKDRAVNVIFDGPPSHESWRFIEVETDDGKGLGCGEWIKRPNGWWALRITHEAIDKAHAELAERMAEAK